MGLAKSHMKLILIRVGCLLVLVKFTPVCGARFLKKIIPEPKFVFRPHSKPEILGAKSGVPPWLSNGPPLNWYHGYFFIFLTNHRSGDQLSDKVHWHEYVLFVSDQHKKNCRIDSCLSFIMYFVSLRATQHPVWTLGGGHGIFSCHVLLALVDLACSSGKCTLN